MKYMFLIVFSILCVHAQFDDSMVPVSVYYESMCPDSIKFFTKQLYPSLQGNWSQYINLTLVPYGKSTEKTVSGQTIFTCHHGQKECEGNKIQACALKRIGDGKHSPNLGYNKVAVAFINCLMAKVDIKGDDTVFPTQDCGAINKVADIHMIENCAQHSESSKLLSDLGAITRELNPSGLSSVPTIVFRNRYNKEDSDLAQENFTKALCHHITNKPEGCNSAVGGSTPFFLIIASSFLIFKF